MTYLCQFGHMTGTWLQDVTHTHTCLRLGHGRVVCFKLK